MAVVNPDSPSASDAASFSTDGGSTWTHVDPTAVFPDDEVGFQGGGVVQYVSSIDRFVWLIQGSRALDPGPRGFRLAFASPADLIASGGTAWTYCTLPASAFGLQGLIWPDLSVGDHYLYLSGEGTGGAPSVDRTMVGRTSLAGIAGGVPGGSITIEYMLVKEPDGSWKIDDFKRTEYKPLP